MLWLGKSLDAALLRCMRNRHFLCGMVLTVLCLPINLSAEIDLQLSRSSHFPGDIIRLEASRVAPEMATFELKIPAQDKLHLVAHQREPVDFHNGKYRQKDVWIFQTMAAGIIQLDGIKAIIRQGAAESVESLSSLSFEVLTYDLATPPSDAPEPLPTSTELSPTSNLVAALTALVAIVLIGGIIWWIRRGKMQPLKEVSPASQRAKLQDILADLQYGDIPVDQMEQLLADPETTVSPPTRAAMEQAVYGSGLSKDSLLTLIEQEVRA